MDGQGRSHTGRKNGLVQLDRTWTKDNFLQLKKQTGHHALNITLMMTIYPTCSFVKVESKPV